MWLRLSSGILLNLRGLAKATVCVVVDSPTLNAPLVVVACGTASSIALLFYLQLHLSENLFRLSLVCTKGTELQLKAKTNLVIRCYPHSKMGQENHNAPWRLAGTSYASPGRQHELANQTPACQPRRRRHLLGHLTSYYSVSGHQRDQAIEM
ncbi:hypothetical protein QBC33DRAFT_311153 [Phialemonium atrogriseum]|uniref:Uncharacterized protein n=1 Tax=Phialemonium atrogriseum TaxID=1093897 RepID=A0AAJ0C512_9PEZI|nr:uncharacterized protein QBC33DRAFT_311153 [Phialemonium atrogriseum]KAK1770071.1 hypothetical protein QBC33DRAFT_311153 [Phialemonium atrogriseum]